MKTKESRSQAPREEWARLYVDESDASLMAVRLLRDASYRVITFPVSGKLGPELRLGEHVYHGLEEIKNLLEEQESMVDISSHPR